MEDQIINLAFPCIFLFFCFERITSQNSLEGGSGAIMTIFLLIFYTTIVFENVKGGEKILVLFLKNFVKKVVS